MSKVYRTCRVCRILHQDSKTLRLTAASAASQPQCTAEPVKMHRQVSGSVLKDGSQRDICWLVLAPNPVGTPLYSLCTAATASSKLQAGPVRHHAHVSVVTCAPGTLQGGLLLLLCQRVRHVCPAPACCSTTCLNLIW